jgi:uncharacterized protein with HEPN domain
VTRHPAERLTDIVAACDAIGAYVVRCGGEEPWDGMVIDAIRMRLLEIGEAVKALDDRLVQRERTVPWKEIARMRDLLAHRYFDADHAIVVTTARRRVPELRDAAMRLLAQSP